jgi:hypothetical protein
MRRCLATLRGRERFTGMAGRRRLLIGGVVAALGVPLSAQLGGAYADAGHQSRKPAAALSVRLAFHRVATPNVAGSLLANGRYVTFEQASGHPCCADVVIDSHTGRRTTLSAPGCDAAAINSRWLLFTCDYLGLTPTLKLYVFATRTWRTITLAPSVRAASGGCALSGPANCGAIDGVGNDWIEFDETGYHGNQQRLFENIATGEVRADPTTRSRIADLNSPSLTRTLCRPLSTPYAAIYDGMSDFYGSVQLYGTFAIAYKFSGGEQAAYLERCGSKLHRLLERASYTELPPMSVNAHAVIWQSGAATLTGLFLPRMKRFTIKLPVASGAPGSCLQPDFGSCLVQIVLTSGKLYVSYQGASLWAAASSSLSSVTPHRRRNHVH